MMRRDGSWQRRSVLFWIWGSPVDGWGISSLGFLKELGKDLEEEESQNSCDQGINGHSQKVSFDNKTLLTKAANHCQNGHHIVDGDDVPNSRSRRLQCHQDGSGEIEFNRHLILVRTEEDIRYRIAARDK